jgi:hypothetical protein
MALATIGSVATTKTLRSNLRELPTYCSTIKGDIELLHSYFDSNYTQIIAHRATVDNFINILLSVYMVVSCNNFRSYIKCKQDTYTDGTLILMHAELIMLATYEFNLLKQVGTSGSNSPDKDQIVAMQAELTALRGQVQLAPNLKKAAGIKDNNRERCKKQGGGDNRKQKNKKNNANKKDQKRDKNWKRTPPRKEKLTRKRSRDVPGVGASTTWRRAIIRKSSADSAVSAPTSKPKASTKSQPKQPQQLS